MLISGFSFVRNATRLYYPVQASIKSILPIVDEFVIAVGKGDGDDYTLQEIQAIRSEKIKIIHTEWDLNAFPGGAEYPHQTDLAKAACRGKWLFYLQSDEVVHERFLPAIRKRCIDLETDARVEGLLFNYLHFWGDYDHQIISHKWYPKEIRIIRNDPEIHSWRDAQSFRRIPGFNGKDYFQQDNTSKLHVAPAHADIYHYGWVRPPALMQKKRATFERHMQGEEKANAMFEHAPPNFNYGNLNKLNSFTGKHPSVMEDFIQKFNWDEEIQKGIKNPELHKHDKLRYRLLTFLEQKLLGGRQIGGFKNYELIKV